MKYSVFLLCLMFNHVALAEKIISTIHSIDQGSSREHYLIRFDNGRASFVSPKKSELIAVLNKSMSGGEFLQVSINKKNEVVSIASSVEDSSISDDITWSFQKEPFKPSVLKSTNDALKVFKKMRRDYTKSGECFNRAHIWSYEENQRTGLNSMKIFMFFTERYIRKYKYHWWFHVTPAFYIGSKKSLKALDRRYTSGPRQTKTWSDAFIKSKRQCKVVSKFDDYWLNQQKQDCYHIYASMYYVIPRDLEKRDLSGEEKSEFIEKEIVRAYRNGFRKKKVTKIL